VSALKTVEGPKLMITVCPPGAGTAEITVSSIDTERQHIARTLQLDARVIPLRFGPGFQDSIDGNTRQTIDRWLSGT